MVGSANHVVQLLVEGKDDNELLTTLTLHHSISMVLWPTATLSESTNYYATADLDDSNYNREGVIEELIRLNEFALEKSETPLNKIMDSFGDDEKAQLCYYIAYFEKGVQQRYAMQDIQINAAMIMRHHESNRREISRSRGEIVELRRQLEELERNRDMDGLDVHVILDEYS